MTKKISTGFPIEPWPSSFRFPFNPLSRPVELLWCGKRTFFGAFTPKRPQKGGWSDLLETDRREKKTNKIAGVTCCVRVSEERRNAGKYAEGFFESVTALPTLPT